MIDTTQRLTPRIRLLERARLVLPALLLAGLCAASVQAQPAEKLPEAEKILDRYVEVTGKIIDSNGPQMIIDNPSQIQTVKPTR